MEKPKGVQETSNEDFFDFDIDLQDLTHLDPEKILLYARNAARRLNKALSSVQRDFSPNYGLDGELSLEELVDLECVLCALAHLANQTLVAWPEQRAAYLRKFISKSIRVPDRPFTHHEILEGAEYEYITVGSLLREGSIESLRKAFELVDQIKTVSTSYGVWDD